MMWYKLFIRFWDRISVRYVKVKDNWELFAVIGYLFSTTDEKIERIDYSRKDFLEQEFHVINIDIIKNKYMKVR